MVIAHSGHEGLCNDVGGLVADNVRTNGVKVRKDEGYVLVLPDVIYPRLLVRVGLRTFSKKRRTPCEVQLGLF